MKGSRLGALFAVCLGSVFVVTETVSATPRGGQGAASIEQCRASAEQGDAVAQFNLTLCYLSGEGGVERSTQRATVWLRQAASQGDCEAARVLRKVEAQE